MTKHTPGPWVFEELAAKDGDGYVLTTEGNRVEIAHHGGAYSMGLPRAEVLANAHLIAAAPVTAAERDHLRTINTELLAALEDATSRLEGFIGADCECDNTHAANGVVCCLCEYRAAIAKAKGESHG